MFEKPDLSELLDANTLAFMIRDSIGIIEEDGLTSQSISDNLLDNNLAKQQSIITSLYTLGLNQLLSQIFDRMEEQ